MSKGKAYEDSPLYKVGKIADDLYCLKEVGMVNIYLLLGTKAAMVIDTGYGYADFKPILKSITNLPLIVVNTHGHPDHALGSYLFDEVFMDEKDYARLVAIDAAKKRNAIHYRYTVYPEAEGNIDEEAYCVSSFENTFFHFVTEGHKFDLGDGQIIELYSLPGHSDGSLGLLDGKNRRFFTGDVITYHNIWNFGDPSQCSFKKLMHTYHKAKAISGRFDEIYSAHGQTPIPVTVLDELIECIYAIRDTKPGEHEVLSNVYADMAAPGKRKYRRAHKNVLILYADDSLSDMLENGFA